MPTRLMFAAYSNPVLRDSTRKAIKQLLWGDEVWVLDDTSVTWRVNSRGRDGWLDPSDVQADRLLEIVFVDIGQGDGALVVTPENRHYVLDAGEGDNMARFLAWRYNLDSEGNRKAGRHSAFAPGPLKLDGAIISHPDADHYAGFEHIFRLNDLEFDTVYTNGLMERAGASLLGPSSKVGGATVYQDLIDNEQELDAFLSAPANWNGKKYPSMLATARSKFSHFRALSASTPARPLLQEPNSGFIVEVLGPVRERSGGLRRLGGDGVTKNGHSVALMLRYGHVRIFMGGDLNIPAEELLIGAHTGLPTPPKSKEDHERLVSAARKSFECDVAKSCHHGSSDVASWFLESLNPIASVISSGDDEPHAHPRADTLGVLGRHSRGPRPLIFSTELSRSAKETIKHPYKLRRDIAELDRAISAANTATTRLRLVAKRDKLLGDNLNRSIATYGAINLRTDGKRVVMGYKIEGGSKKTREWDLYRLEPGAGGALEYRSKHE